jgi:predicted nucleotidyltransferase
LEAKESLPFYYFLKTVTMARHFPEKIDTILKEVKERLGALYPDRLKEVILFGSYARGDYTEGSDIDLLVLLDRLDKPDAERERYLSVVCDLSLKYDTVVSVVPMEYRAFHSKKTPLTLNVTREGVRL